MFAGDKGLATHQQVKHGRSYESAKAAVAESRVALVATQSAPHRRFTGRPRRTVDVANPAPPPPEKERVAPGLAAAGDGDLNALRELSACGLTRRGASLDTSATRCTGPPVPATSACANTWSTRAAWTRGRRRLGTAVTPCTGRRVTEKRTCASGCGARKG